MTPECFWPTGSSRIRPNFISFFPEHLFGSQWPKSQQAALYAGRSSLESSSPRGPRVRVALLYFLPLDENPSFLCRTILSTSCPDFLIVVGTRKLPLQISSEAGDTFLPWDHTTPSHIFSRALEVADIIGFPPKSVLHATPSFPSILSFIAFRWKQLPHVQPRAWHRARQRAEFEKAL